MFLWGQPNGPLQKKSQNMHPQLINKTIFKVRKTQH